MSFESEMHEEINFGKDCLSTDGLQTASNYTSKDLGFTVYNFLP